MSVRLQLVAHGPTAATRAGRFPLDEPLDAPAQRALDGRTRLLTAPELRCRQTFGDELLARATIVPELADWAVGSWAGQHVQAMAASADLERWRTDPGWAVGGAESLEDVTHRVTRWLGTLADGHVTAVTHPMVVRAALVVVLETPTSTFWHLDVEPGAQVALTRHSGRWHVRWPATRPQTTARST